MSAPDGSRVSPSLRHGLVLLRFLRWTLPYLRRTKAPVALSLALSAVALSAAAAVPLLVEEVLTYSTEQESSGVITGEDITLLAVIAGAICIDLASSYGARTAAIRVVQSTGARMREVIFRHLLTTSLLRQIGLRRPSIVSRNTSDVERVDEAVLVTLTEGLPGVARVIISLTLLYSVEPRAGLVMLVAAVLFLLLRGRVGRRMLRTDRAALDANSDVAAVVDESITAESAVTGLRIQGWQTRRLLHQAQVFERAIARQLTQVTRLHVGARTAGLIGLLAVVGIATASEAADIGTLAAALLYVEATVRGLEALPGWLRAIQLGVTAQSRIDDILLRPSAILARGADRAALPEGDGPSSGLRLAELVVTGDSPGPMPPVSAQAEPGRLLAVVSSGTMDVTRLRAAIAGDADPDSGAAFLDGVDARGAAARARIARIPEAAVGFDASVREHLEAAAGDHLDDARIDALLDLVGLGHLHDLADGGLDGALGPQASRLAAAERSRLLLAMGIACDPDLLVLDDLPVLADPDEGRALLEATRAEGRIVVYTPPSTHLAELSDTVLLIDGETALVDTHASLLVRSRAYADLWHREVDADLLPTDVVAGLGLADPAGALRRMVTERYRAGELIYREGAPADRLVFVASGRVELCIHEDTEQERRLAVLGPGMQCGHLTLTAGERRAESLRALDDCVVRSLSRQAWSASLLGILDLAPAERALISTLLRDGPADEATLVQRLGPQAGPILAALTAGGQVRRGTDGLYSVVHQRRARPGAAGILDRLSDPE